MGIYKSCESIAVIRNGNRKCHGDRFLPLSDSRLFSAFCSFVIFAFREAPASFRRKWSDSEGEGGFLSLSHRGRIGLASISLAKANVSTSWRVFASYWLIRSRGNERSNFASYLGIYRVASVFPNVIYTLSLYRETIPIYWKCIGYCLFDKSKTSFRVIFFFTAIELLLSLFQKKKKKHFQTSVARACQ